MTLLEIDAKYAAALAKGATFGGHPAQLEAAAAMFNMWPLLKVALEEQARNIQALRNTIIDYQNGKSS